VKRLQDEAPRSLESGRFEQVHDAASSLRDLKASKSDLPEVLGQHLVSYLGTFSGEDAIARILAAATRSPSPLPEEIVGLFRIAGAAAAEKALRRLSELPDGPELQRVTELIVAASADALTAAIGQLRTEGWAALRVLFPVLLRCGPPRSIEIALTFVGNDDPRVRIEAYRVLLATDQREGQAVRYLGKSLSDESPRVVAFAVGQARHRGGPEMTGLLGAYLRRELGGADDAEVQAQAIASLASFATSERRAILIELLRTRKVAYKIKEMRVITALEESLTLDGDEASLRAVRSWRRSFKRWLSVLLVHGRVRGA
jgi:hypothetical protein